MMNKVKLSLIYIYILLVSIISISSTFAQTKNDVENIRIVPAVKNAEDIVKAINNQKGVKGEAGAGKCADMSFWARYECNTEGLKKDPGAQIQGGFINFDTIIIYAAYLIRVISNIAIAIGAFFVVRGGYEYVLQAFGYKPKAPISSYLQNIIIGIFVMMFAFGIIKLLTFTFL